MDIQKKLVINKIIKEFQICSQIRFNGQLEWHDKNQKICSFYYLLGRIVWATGGVHPVRRWQRQMNKHCPEVKALELNFSREDLEMNVWDYNILSILYKQMKIGLKEISAVVDGTIQEVLFDLFQQSFSSPLKSQRQQQQFFDMPMTLRTIQLFLGLADETRQACQAWQDAGLEKLSPHLAPIVRQREKLRQQIGVNERVYQNIVKLMNGQNTFLDLSALKNQDLLPLTLSLFPYIKSGIIEAIEVSDLPLPIKEIQVARSNRRPRNNNAPLIACVDDSPQIRQMIEQIITPVGFRFIGIEDPLEVLPVLIEKKPNLIFLDLIMPMMNGYEVCSQLRIISQFAHTPIIILTGNDGIVDRVRAKMVKASDFMGKPVEAEKVLAIIDKYLHSMGHQGV